MDFQLEFSIEFKKLMDKFGITAGIIILEKDENVTMAICNEADSLFMQQFSIEIRNQLEQMNEGPADGRYEFLIKANQ